jgi:hypothetical protein
MCRSLLVPTAVTLGFLLVACDRSKAIAAPGSSAKSFPATRSNNMPAPMKSIELKAVQTAHGPLALTVSGATHPNDGLTDLALVIRLQNKGATPVALLNGGTTHDPKRGVFFVEADGDGVVTLVQKAYPLPDPTPTVPAIPAATVLAPGESVETRWRATLEALGLNRPYMGFPNAGAPYSMPRPVKKIRVCVAYKAFDAKAFEAIKGHQGFFMPIGAAIDREQMLVCSPVIAI